MRWGLTALMLAVVLSALLAGCQQQFTRQRFETLYVGQPAEDVREVLGEPTVEYPNEWRYVTDRPYAMGTVYFADGKVTRKTWANERSAATRPDMP